MWFSEALGNRVWHDLVEFRIIAFEEQNINLIITACTPPPKKKHVMSLVSCTGVFLVSEQRITFETETCKDCCNTHPYFVEDWYFEGLEKAIYAEFFSPSSEKICRVPTAHSDKKEKAHAFCHTQHPYLSL